MSYKVTDRERLLENLYHIYRTEHPPWHSQAWVHMQAIGRDLDNIKRERVLERRQREE